jgi:hypothetical protein
LPNGSCLNRDFKKAGVAYVAHPTPGTKANIEASKKRKAYAVGKTAVKRAKSATKKKSGAVKIIQPKGKSNLKRPFDTELALVKPVKTIFFFAFAHPVDQVSGPSNVGGSAPHAQPMVGAASNHVKMLPFLEESSSKSYMPLPHDLTCHIPKFLFQNVNHFSLINSNFLKDFIYFNLK